MPTNDTIPAAAGNPLQVAREAKAKREAKRATELEALELEALNLEEKYETSGQKLGVDFAIHTSLVGNFVVRKPEFLVGKKFSDCKDKSTEDVVQFVSPCILFPETMTARGLLQEHGGLAWELAAHLLKLFGANANAVAGK